MIEHQNAAHPSKPGEEGHTDGPHGVGPHGVGPHGVGPHSADADRMAAGFEGGEQAASLGGPPAPLFEWPALSQADAERIQAERARQEQLHQDEMERAWFEQVMSEAKLQLETDPTFREEVSAFLSKPFVLIANPVRALGRRFSSRPSNPIPASPSSSGDGSQSVPPPKPTRASSPPRLSAPPRVSSPPRASSPPRVSSPPIDVDADSIRRSSVPPAAVGRGSEPERQRVSDLPARRSSLPPEAPVYPRLPTQQSLSPESIAELERYFTSQPPPPPLPVRQTKWSAPLLLSGGAFGISLFVALTWLSNRIVNSEQPPKAPAVVVPRAQLHSAATANEPNGANDIVVLDDPPLSAAPGSGGGVQAKELESEGPEQPAASRGVSEAVASPSPPVRVPIGSLEVLNPQRRSNTTVTANVEPQQNKAAAAISAATVAPLPPSSASLARAQTPAGNAPTESASSNISAHRLLAPEQTATPKSGLRVYRRGDQPARAH